MAALGCRDQWEFDEGGLAGGVVDALGGFAKIGGLGPKGVRDESLRIAIVEREPGGLDLHHDAVAGQKNVIGGGEREAVEERLVWREGFRRFETFAVVAAKNVGGDHELIASHFRLRADFVGVKVDELDDPVGVSAAGGGD